MRRKGSVHLAQCTSNLGPDGIDVIIKGLQGEDLELGLVVGEKAQHSGCRDETGHDNV